jgi:malate/lactate dehydrogenase
VIELHYYKTGDSFLFSRQLFDDLEDSDEGAVKNHERTIYYLGRSDPLLSRRGFKAMSACQLENKAEGLELLENKEESMDLPDWIKNRIFAGDVKVVNKNYPNWKDELDPLPEKWKINIAALGDVGSTLAIGLRLLGKNISDIGLYDRSPEKQKRWEYELNQIRRPFDEGGLPKVASVSEEDLFNCDMLVFCASKGIPPVGSNVSDVRMAQFEGNREIIHKYAKMARNIGFKGYFAVVSDPVDPLCKAVFIDSNSDDNGEMDFNGIASNKIIGFGLGVMDARAAFYAERDVSLGQYLREGQVFGPHGNGLIVADSMIDYNNEKSIYLTEKTVKANLEIRALGYKPYVAPSLSSGSLSIIAAIQGEYFYGSSLMGHVYMGSKIRITDSGLEVPQYSLHPLLKERLKETYNGLRSII